MAVFLGVLLSGGVMGCQDEPPSLTPEQGEAVSSIAEPVAAELLRTLLGRLTASLEEEGTVGAIEFCSNHALPLTRAVQGEAGPGLQVKRTSFRVRNPVNAPDEAEEEALTYFEDFIGRGEAAPPSYVQRVTNSEFRYYRPLFVADVCTGCHGSEEAMDPEVRAILRDRYPADLATGYQVGDFRGVVRVSVPVGAVGG